MSTPVTSCLVNKKRPELLIPWLLTRRLGCKDGTLEGYILQSICRFCKMFNFKFKFSVSITSGNVNVYLYWKWLLQGTWWMFLVATLNSNAQTKTKPFQTARAELPSLPARFCKIWNANFLKIFTFSQEFLLSWDKDLDFLLAGHWEYMFLLLLEFFPHVILIAWGLESGLAKFFFAESVPLWYLNSYLPFCLVESVSSYSIVLTTILTVSIES